MLAHLEALVADLPAATTTAKGSKHDPQKELGRQRAMREAQLARNLAQLAESKPRATLEGDPAVANRWLRGIISKIWVDSGLVTSVEL